MITKLLNFENFLENNVTGSIIRSDRSMNSVVTSSNSAMLAVKRVVTSGYCTSGCAIFTNDLIVWTGQSACVGIRVWVNIVASWYCNCSTAATSIDSVVWPGECANLTVIENDVLAGSSRSADCISGMIGSGKQKHQGYDESFHYINLKLNFLKVIRQSHSAQERRMITKSIISLLL